MKLTTIPLITFLIASIMTLIGMYLDNNFIVLLCKPVIIPAIYFYYLQIKEDNVNWKFTLAIMSCFIADMLAIIVFESSHFYIIFFNLICYIIFFHFALKDIIVTKIKKIKIGYTIMLLTISFLFLFYLIDLIPAQKKSLEVFFLIYGTVLAFLITLIGFNFFLNNSLKNLFAVLMSVCFLMSDIFYSIHNFYEKIMIFYILNLTLQFLSYYFMVKYITCPNSKIPDTIK